MTRCCIPHCRNKSRKSWLYYICGPHWRTAAKRLKARRRAIHRALVRRKEATEGAGYIEFHTARANRLESMVWAAIKRSVCCMCKRQKVEGHCGPPEEAEAWRCAIACAQRIARECVLAV